MKLTIYSYNLHSGRNVFFKNSFHRIKRYFQHHPADILAFQEVQNNSRNGWHFQSLKDGLHPFAAYGINLSIADGHYGNAVFTRFPILHSQNIPLPSLKEQRGALYTELNVSGTIIRLLNVHLGLGKKERAAQIGALQSFISSLKHPIIVVGDFNTTFPPPFQDLVDLGKQAGIDRSSTVFPIKRRIDYVFASKSLELLHYEVVSLPYSDHYPIKVILRSR